MDRTKPSCYGPEPISMAAPDHDYDHIQDKHNTTSVPPDESSRHQSHREGQQRPRNEAFAEDSAVISGSEKSTLVKGLVEPEQRHEELGKDADTEPKLEIVNQCEVFTRDDDDVASHHTQLVLKRCKDHFWAISKQRESKLEHLDMDSLDLVPIPREYFCPLVKEGITEAPEPSSDVFFKRPYYMICDPSGPKPGRLRSLVLQEAEICEILNKHPHPNIVRYLGCVVEDNRITGLCFAKCTSTLSEKLARSTPHERNTYYEGIKRGVGHLHQLGLVHNGLHPSNIMMDGDTPVIINFDSCRPNGEKLGAKGGALGWTVEEAELATPENDFYSLEKMRQYIMKGGGVEFPRCRGLE